MAIYRGATKVAGVGKGFSPENTGNTGDKLEKTPSGYQWVDGELVELKADDYSAMRGPCADGFHILCYSEAVNLKTVINTILGRTGTGNDLVQYLLIPAAGYIVYNSGNKSGQGTSIDVWTSSKSDYTGYIAGRVFGASNINSEFYYTRYNRRGTGFPIRPFKDAPVIPDNTWTTLYDASSVADGAGIFHNSTLGLISLSDDGSNWITLADKNLGATSTDTSITDSYGKYYQWGNNYGFTSGYTTSSTRVNASSYGPGNYYSSSTFIITSNNEDWSTVQNDNLWGGVTGILNSKYAGGEKIAEVPSIGITGQVLTKTNNGYEFKNSDYLSSPFYKLLNGKWTELSTDTYTIPTTAGSGQIGNYRNIREDYKIYKIELVFSYSVIREGIFFAYPNMSSKTYRPEIIVPLNFDGNQNPMIYIELECQVGYSSGKTYINKQKSTYRLKNSVYGGASFTEKIYGIK